MLYDTKAHTVLFCVGVCVLYAEKHGRYSYSRSDADTSGPLLGEATHRYLE